MFILHLLRGRLSSPWLQGPCFGGTTSPSQKALVGTIPTIVPIPRLTTLSADAPLTFHGSLPDEKSRREDSPTRRCWLDGIGVAVATKSGAAAPNGSYRMCHL